MFVDRRAKRFRMNRVDVAMDQPAAIEFTQDRKDAARRMDVFDVIFLDGRRDLADVRHFAREPIHVLHREIDASLMGDAQNMQDGIRRSAHGDVEGHGILEGFEGGDASRQDAVVTIDVVAVGQFHDSLSRAFEEFPALGVRRQDRAVAR